MAIDGVTGCMKIREVNKNKKQFISLLLLADEQESMVDRYLEKGTMYVLEDNDVKAHFYRIDNGCIISLNTEKINSVITLKY